MEITDEKLFFGTREWISSIFKNVGYKESLTDFILIQKLIIDLINDDKKNSEINKENPFKEYNFSAYWKKVLLRFINQRYGICVEKDFITDLWDEVWYLLQRYNEQEEML